MQRVVLVGLVCLWGAGPAASLYAAEDGLRPGVDAEGQLARAREALAGGRLAEADSLYSAVIRQEDSTGVADARLARTLYELGLVRRFEGRSEAACELIRRGIRILAAVPNPNARELSRMWQALGTAYYRCGRYLDGEQAHSKAWDLEAAAAAPDAQRLVDILSALAADCERLGRHAETEAIFERIRSLMESDRLNRHQQAVLLNNQGTLRRLQGRIPEAEAAFRQALLVAEKISDPRDPTAVYLLDNLGVVMLDRKAYREASPLFAQSMALIEAGAEVAPEDMPQLLRNYATSLERTGRKKEARAAMVRAGALARELPEDRASGAAVSVNELAQGR